ncbi:MAG: FAD-binding oxidoreductase [Pseudotabrizicola sp.]|uniref:FAD-binding oxidoreductase n=1 Tax=Pseudotabrizicola sp. TaxID=2939647 RepID=UPI0027312090|nr:FAD-binding oxidoreductase [Pseudotabrizicola sp.]MDP2080893.1 FAD-binding oxidoreductase [Pseudotabrizicola sp.]MDZ7572705.1 FAD-binding oxidoreductase [Pseudotabrizicola sp.]
MLNPCTQDFTAALASAHRGVLRDVAPRDVADPRGRWQGQGGAVACPRTTAEVAAVVAACNAASVGIIPLGGGTGLVGGQVMPDGPAPLILSLERMTALRAAFPAENVLLVEAGMILADVQAEADRVDRLFPLSLASEGSARIGGNLAANAGGLNVLRYGNTRDLCLGLEAVLPDGSIFNGLKRLRKDNTGYDLRHLLIGSEGTLGIITAASLRLFPKPSANVVALLSVPSPRAALDLLALAERQLAGLISAFELINRMGYDFLAETMPEVAVPLLPVPEWSVLIELGLPQGMAPEEAMASLYAQATEAGLVLDGVIATSQAQAAALWRIRESIPEGNRRIGAVSSHDISLPLSAIPDFIPRAGVALARLGEWRINCFGHLGDGNLHYNVFPVPGRSRRDHENQRDAVKTCVHDIVHDMGGSVSAEHGIGRLKVDDLVRYGDPTKLAAMRAIKAALDPKGIMNPGAVMRG